MKIISGGQTGADIGALIAAKELGIETGGHIAEHYRTADGLHPEYAELYGLVDTKFARNYEIRTRFNVKNSDGTLLIGAPSSGFNLTNTFCKRLNKPLLIITYPDFKENLELDVLKLRILSFVKDNNISVLNVAGNRESVNKGIKDFTINLILHTFKK